MKIRNILLINLMVLSFNLMPADEGQGKEGQPKNPLLSKLIKNNIVDIALQQLEKNNLQKIQEIFKLIQDNPDINPEQIKKYLRYLIERKSHWDDELKINGGPENLKITIFRARYEEAKKNLQTIEDILNKMSKMQFEGLNIERTIEQLKKESESCVIA